MEYLVAAFALGEALEILVVWLGGMITYTTNLLTLCISVGVAAIVLLAVGIYGTRVELAEKENRISFVGEFPKTGDAALPDILGKRKATEMEEAAPIPDELEVTNDSIKRAES